MSGERLSVYTAVVGAPSPSSMVMPATAAGRIASTVIVAICCKVSPTVVFVTWNRASADSASARASDDIDATPGRATGAHPFLEPAQHRTITPARDVTRSCDERRPSPADK